MRIQIDIPPSCVKRPAPTSSDPPLIQIGGETVLMELQGDLTFEGEPGGKVIGLLGLERMDKPTLHLGKHHLLHGKISNLLRPLAIIRRVDSRDLPSSSGRRGDEDDDDEEKGARSDAEDEAEDAPELEEETQGGPLRDRKRLRLDRKLTSTSTSSHNPISGPSTSTIPPSSSPPRPDRSNNRDYSSDLSSPVRPFAGRSGFSGAKHKIDRLGIVDEREPLEIGEVDVDADVEMKESGRGPSKDAEIDEEKQRPLDMASERTKEYKVVGVVRKKVVFSLRPEPIVTATILPD